MINIQAPTVLVATGKLRATINLGNPILARQCGTQVTGVSVDLARELAHRLDVDVEFVVVPSTRRAAEAISSGKADVGFFAVDPERGRGIAFTDPYAVEQQFEVAVGVRQQLEADMARFPGLRMLDGLISIRQALGLPPSKGDKALRFLHAFVADVNASGFVAECLARHGVQGVSIAPQIAHCKFEEDQP